MNFILNMKKITLTLLLAATALAGAAQRYIVTGKAKDGAKVVYLRNLENRDQRDSVAVAADGTFKFEGHANGKYFAEVGQNDSKDVLVVLDGNVSVDLESETASGTTENKLLHEANKQMQPILVQVMDITSSLREMQKNGVKQDAPEFQAAYTTYMELLDKLRAQTKQTVIHHKDALFPAVLMKIFGPTLQETDLLELAELKPVAFETSLLSDLNAQLAVLRLRAPGQPFIDLRMPDPGNVFRSLSEYVGKGNYVLIDFWASWCGPCMREMPAIKALYEKYKAKGFDIVGVSLDQDKAAWKGAIKRLDLPWHHISDLKGWKSAATAAYGINSIPATLLVDPEGKIVAFGLRAEGLAEKLQEIYGE